MKENKLPTAEFLLNTLHPDLNFQEYWFTHDPQVAKRKIEKSMIEFAKLHVQEALKAASENADLIETDGDVDKSTILNAYPLDKIQ